MRIFTPVGGEPSLMIGMPDFEDSTIFFITQAADIRADNMQILGDFVLRGEQIAKGRTKLGWCAIIDGNISIGYDKEPAALQEAILSGGYFFRRSPADGNIPAGAGHCVLKTVRTLLSRLLRLRHFRDFHMSLRT